MNRIIKLIFFAVFLISAITLGVGAESGEEEYTVKKCENGYMLVASDREEYFDSLEDLIDEIESGSTLRLDGVKAKRMTVNKEITLCGTANFEEKITVSESGTLNLCGIDLSFAKDGGISVEGGTLSVKDSYITSSLSAVTLKNYSSSRLEVYSGEISADGVAIKIDKGTAVISGGIIKGQGEAAVRNSGTLYISGSPSFDGCRFDILTTDPVSLSFSENYFLGELDIKLTGEFYNGGIYQIARGARAEQEGLVRIYDVNNSLYNATYFDDDEKNTYKNSLCVYLPYRISYNIPGGNSIIKEALSGEPLTSPEVDLPDGFLFGGWYLDEAYSEIYDFSRVASGDLNLYCSFILCEPQFSLKNYSHIYTGEVQSVEFDCIYHPLMEEGVLSYVWYDREGNEIAYSRALRVKDVSDTGEYRCRVIFTYGSYKSEAVTPFIKVDIDRVSVEIPKIDSAVYDGSVKYPYFYDPRIVYEGEGFTEAGVYSITFKLFDRENFVFSDGGTETSVNFEIKKADNYWITPPSISDYYDGESPSISGKAAYGSVEFLFSSEEGGEYLPKLPKGVGIYFFKAFVNEGDNYKELSSMPVAFSVLKERVEEIWISEPPKKSEYKAFELLNKEGLIIMARYSSGRVETIDTELVSVRYQSGESLRFLDTGVIIEYSSLNAFLPLTVTRIDYIMSETVEDVTLIYDGEFHTPLCDIELPLGLDGSSPSYKISGGGLNAGEYLIKVSFESGSINYNAPKSISFKLIIAPKRVSAIWDRAEFIYDGSIKLPCAYFVGVYGDKIALTVNGGAINAGDGYIARASNPDENYFLENPTQPFRISKANYLLEGVSWSAESFVYSAESFSVTLLGLPDGVRVIGYANNTATLAGEYTATAVLSYDKENYNEPEIPPYLWRIEKGEYDLSSIGFYDNEAIYDGSPKYPLVLGELIPGKDGSLPTYSFTKGAINVTDGTVTVAISFSTDSTNYEAPGTIYRTVTILPMGVEVEWSGTELTYDGRALCPVASSPIVPIRTEGAQINAGEYTAFAYSCDFNYYVINSTVSFTVLKAPNRFILSPKVEDVFFGQNPSPTAKSLYGEVEFFYYSDRDLICEEQLPLKAGDYYLVCRVKEADNYLPLVSEPLFFSVKAILPTGISISLVNKSFTAFEKISPDDFECLIINNDGSVTGASEELVEIKYGEGNTLLAGENSISFSYRGFSTVHSVVAEKARIDLSDIYWQGSNAVYDGEAKSMLLMGLPDGVSVKEYVYPTAVNAGEYEVTVFLSFDSRNYLDPGAIKGVLTVERAPITPSVLNAPTYDGSAKIPLPSSTIYSFVIPSEYVGAGKYSVKAELCDANYLLTDEYAEFVIAPASVTVRVDNAVLYWLEDEPRPSYSLLSGALYGEDGEKIRTYVSGERTSAFIDSLNYELTVIEGELVRKAALSPRATRAVFISLLIFLLILLFSVALVRGKLRPVLILEGIRADRGRADASVGASGADTPSVINKEELPEGISIDAKRAESMLTDQAARTLIRKSGRKKGIGFKRAIINVGQLSEAYLAGETVDIESLKEKGLIHKDTVYLKVLADGSINKPLYVYADAYSLAAVKMIALSGGTVNKTNFFFIGEEKNE